MASHGHHVLGRLEQIDGKVQMPFVTGGTKSPLKLSLLGWLGRPWGVAPSFNTRATRVKVTLGVTGYSGRRVRIGGRAQYIDVGSEPPQGAEA